MTLKKKERKKRKPYRSLLLAYFLPKGQGLDVVISHMLKEFVLYLRDL